MRPGRLPTLGQGPHLSYTTSRDTIDIEDALKRAGLTVLDLSTAVEAGLEQVGSGIAAQVQVGEAEPALVQVRLIVAGENVPQRFAVNATGPCRLCGVVAPLKPAVELPQKENNAAEVAATLGQALTFGTAEHDCGEGGSGAGEPATGQYL